MATHTLEVTGITDEMLRQLDERIRESGGDRVEFVRELIRREIQRTPLPPPDDAPVHAGMTFAEILAPVHQQTAMSEIREADLEQFLSQARDEVRAAKREVVPR